ncbi:MAG: M24 family metallopeptidase [Caldilineaceae bacterium]
MNIELKTIPMPLPAFVEEDAPAIPAEEYERRLETLYEMAGADWVAVYADREHYANLMFLVNLDPRFEEAVLLLGPRGRRVLLLGNEDMGYTSVLSVPVEAVLCQSLSLGGQPRGTAPRVRDVLAHVGVAPGASVCVVGWKYLEENETDDTQAPAFVPAFLLDALRSVIGSGGRLVDGTALLMHPAHGLRSLNGGTQAGAAAQIAAFEWGARMASAAVFNVLRHARPGMSERKALSYMRYAGDALSMHPILVSGKGAINGLRSPSAKTIEYGDGVSVGLGYWGSLVCRAGMMLGAPDAGYFEGVVTPYYRAIATWHQTMRIGVTGGEVFGAIDQAFGTSPLRPALNPGHLTSYDEWVHSPIRAGSTEKVRSGMVFQCDIIPTPLPPGQLTNCEDTVAVADEGLRAELRANYPALWARVEARRKLMVEALGIHPAEELLPLTEATAYLPPFWLAPELVCTVRG